MNSALVFGVIAALQVAFLILLFVFLSVRRRYDRQRQAAFMAGKSTLSVPLRDWVVAGTNPAALVAALRELPKGTAVGYLALLARQTITIDQRDSLAELLRQEPWIHVALAQRHSRYWWRRLESARALSILGTMDDQPAVAALLRDEHPAVQVAAASALPRVADAEMLGHVIDELFAVPKVVRQYVTTVLRQTRGMAGEALTGRIQAGTERAELAAWIELAASIDHPQAIAASIQHAAHRAPAVRRAVTKALARHPGPDAVKTLIQLLQDADFSVRALAARGLGQLGSATSVPALAPLLADHVWQVRLRAALSLAQLGERGRAALRVAREGNDRFAREMATMVSGLTDGAVLELGDS